MQESAHSDGNTSGDPLHGFMRKPRCPCSNCQKPNCGKCTNCLGKVKFGGDGRNRRRCLGRMCLGPVRASTKKADNGTQTSRVEKEKAKQPVSLPRELSVPDDIPNSPGTSVDSNAAKRRVKRRRCGTCPGCLAPECGLCLPCKDHPKFGGEGRTHACCLKRQCQALYPHLTSNGTTRVRDLTDRRMKDDTNPDEPPAKRIRRPPSRDIPTQKPARRVRCGKCPPCKRPPCETCEACIEKQRIGRDCKRACDYKRCRVLYPPGSGSEALTEDKNHIAPKVRVARTGSMKHGENSRIAPRPTCPLPTLSDYMNSRKKVAGPVQPTSHKPETIHPIDFCGLAVPPCPEENSCTACRGDRDDELEGQLIVLCDGPNCNREYHLDCTHPLLLEIPRNDWLCEDCSPDGSTSNLVRYFEKADERKASFFLKRPEGESPSARQAAYIDHLLMSDCQLSYRPTDRFPRSELDRSALLHAAAIESDQSCFGRTRGATETDDPLAPSSLVGCLIRVYSSMDCLYHTGRIVDERRIGNELGEHILANTEFLVRFSAGKDGRKQAYQHWVVLEEHATAVGTTVGWAQIGMGIWEPAIVWIRSAREMITVQDKLKASEGEIRFRSADSKNDTNEIGAPIKTSHRVFGFVKTLGTDVYRFLNLRTHVCNIEDTHMLSRYLGETNAVRMQYHMAKAEIAEQAKVKRWGNLPLLDPLGPTALSSRDEYMLPLLELKPLVGPLSSMRASPCPSIPRGLDRSKLMKLLERRSGFVASKDTAASISSCKIVEMGNGQEKKNNDGPALEKIF